MIQPFKGKKVTVMGLGLHGGGLASVLWLVKQGAKVTVTDLKTKKQLENSVNQLKKYKINFVLGRHRESDFKNTDLIIQNPGVPRESKFLKIAKKYGVPIENNASLFFKFCPAVIIGVTGTRGKSTTSALIYEFLKVGNRKVWLAGLPQKPILENLEKIKENDLVVLELSSWQLEILGQNKLSPDLSVITNIYPDHMNRYSSAKDYIKAKENIFLWQTSQASAVLNRDNTDTFKMGKNVLAKRFWFSKKYFKEENGVYVKNSFIYFRYNGNVKKIASLRDIKLFGQHNLENVLAALAIALQFKLTQSQVKSVLSKFKGLSGRLELVKTKLGIKFINDTTATTPDAAIAALNLASKKNVILIAGGASKNLPEKKYQELAKIIKIKCKAVVLFSGSGSDQIIKPLKKDNFKPLVFNVNSMFQAVTVALSFAKKGDTVLLSPACASFGIFIHEYDRGDQFNQIVIQL